MSDDYLAAIKKRVSAAHGDWWEYRDGEIFRHWHGGAADSLLCYGRIPHPDNTARFRSEADARLVASAKTDLTALLTENDRLRKLLARLEGDDHV